MKGGCKKFCKTKDWHLGCSLHMQGTDSAMFHGEIALRLVGRDCLGSVVYVTITLRWSLVWVLTQLFQSWCPWSFLLCVLVMSLLSASSGLKTVLASHSHAQSLAMASCIAGEHPSSQVGLTLVKPASWIEQDSACLWRQSAGRPEVSVRQPRLQGVGGTPSRTGIMSNLSLQLVRRLRR